MGKMGRYFLTAFASRISYQEKSDFLIRQSNFTNMWLVYSGAPLKREQEEKDQQNTRVCSEDQFPLEESPIVHRSEDHEQREVAEVGSGGAAFQQ